MEKPAAAKRIIAFRKLKGHTQKELADLVGVTVAIIGAIERGARKPDAIMIHRISEVLDIEQAELTPEE